MKEERTMTFEISIATVYPEYTTEYVTINGTNEEITRKINTIIEELTNKLESREIQDFEVIGI